MEFSLFLLALYLLWDNFLISEMTSTHVNNTTKKTPCQPQSVHSLGMLRAENATLPHLRDIWLRTRYKWDTRFWGGILRSVDWQFLVDVSGQQSVVVKFSQRCWWRFKSSGTFRPVDWSIYLHLQGQQPKMKALRSTETSVTLHQSTGRNLQHLCENVMSDRLGYRAGPSYWYEDHCRIHKSPTMDIFFIPCIMIY